MGSFSNARLLWREGFADPMPPLRALGDSVLAESVILMIAATAGYWSMEPLPSAKSSELVSTRVGGGSQVAAAGFWYTFVSLSVV